MWENPQFPKCQDSTGRQWWVLFAKRWELASSGVGIEWFYLWFNYIQGTHLTLWLLQIYRNMTGRGSVLFPIKVLEVEYIGVPAILSEQDGDVCSSQFWGDRFQRLLSTSREVGKRTCRSKLTHKQLIKLLVLNKNDILLLITKDIKLTENFNLWNKLLST